MDDKVERRFNKPSDKNQHLEREEIGTEEVQLLSPMVFSQPINGHLSSNTFNDKSVLELDTEEVTPLTKGILC